MRRLRRDISTFALTASVPLALAFVFPYEAFDFHPAEDLPRATPHCAFVALTAAEERAALAAARASWQVGAKGVRGLRADLSADDLPPAPVRPVIPTRTPPPRARFSRIYQPDELPPSVGAGAPVVLAPDKDEPAAAPAFSREELLKID